MEISDNSVHTQDKTIYEEIQKLKEDKKYRECLAIAEKHLYDISEKQGRHSVEYIKTAYILCEICNLIALSQKDGLSYLTKCENKFKNNKEISHYCYMNIAYYYKKYFKQYLFYRVNKYSLSLKYYEYALYISHELNDKIKAGNTHLFTAVLLAVMGKYDKIYYIILLE
jgi:hypothetical protein